VVGRGPCVALRSVPPMLTSLTRFAMVVSIVAAGLVTASAGAAPQPTNTSATTVASDRSAPDLSLPHPRGPLPVAATALHLVDRSRLDPWVPKPGHRELMVSMFYPTYSTTGPRAKYMTAAESEAIIDAQRQGGEIPDDIPGTILSTVDSHVVRDTFPLPRLGGRPLIVLSPGFSMSRSSLTGLASHLASRGYVVAAIDHAHESLGIEMPDERLVTCAACDTENFANVPPGRSEDVSFVLDRLFSPRSAWSHSWMIDRDRIGVAGHSIGGNSAASVLQEDPRVDAGVNLDGTFFDRLDGAIDRPFMMIGTRQLHTPGGGDPSWPRAWRKLRGPRYWFTVRGSNHGSFTDFPVLTEQAGVEPGALPGQRSMRLTRAYVGAFFDRHLRGLDRPVLDDESPAWPEVNAHHE